MKVEQLLEPISPTEPSGRDCTFEDANQKVLGQMDEKRLDAVQKFYVDEGIVAKAQPLADLYTNQFTGVAR